MKKIILTTVCALLLAPVFFSCSGGKKELSEGFFAIELPTGNKEKNINMSRVAESISYIPLETTEDCRIESIQKIVPMKDYLIIMDIKSWEHVYLFTKEGKFVREISSKGTDENQYAILGDVTADPENNRIFILDAARRMILEFDSEGTFLSKTPTLFYVANFQYIADSTLALNPNYNNSKYFGGDTPNLILMNLQDGVTGRYVVRPKALDPSYMLGVRSNFSRTKDGVTFIAPLCDTVFLATKSGVRPLYLADFGNNNEALNKKYIEDVLKSKPAIYSLDKLYESLDNVFMSGFYAYDDVVLATYSKQGRNYSAFFYPESGKLITGCSLQPNVTIPVANDMDGITVFSPLGSQGNSMYCYTTLGLVEGGNDTMLPDEAKKIKDSLKPGDNLVLAVVNLKNK